MGLLDMYAMLASVEKSELDGLLGFFKNLDNFDLDGGNLAVMAEHAKEFKKNPEGRTLTSKAIAAVYNKIVEQSEIGSEKGGIKGISLQDFMLKFGEYTKRWAENPKASEELKAGIKYLAEKFSILAPFINNENFQKKLEEKGGIKGLLDPVLEDEENTKLLNEYLELGFKGEPEQIKEKLGELLAPIDFFLREDKKGQIIIGGSIGNDLGRKLGVPRAALMVINGIGGFRLARWFKGRIEKKVLDSYTARSFKNIGLAGVDNQLSSILIALDFISKNSVQFKPEEIKDKFKTIMKVLIAKEKGNFEVLDIYEKPSKQQLLDLKTKAEERIALANTLKHEIGELEGKMKEFTSKFIEEFKDKLVKPEKEGGFSDKSFFEILSSLKDNLEGFNCVQKFKTDMQKTSETNKLFEMIAFLQGDVVKDTLSTVVDKLVKEVLKPQIYDIIDALPIDRDSKDVAKVQITDELLKQFSSGGEQEKETSEKSKTSERIVSKSLEGFLGLATGGLDKLGDIFGFRQSVAGLDDTLGGYKDWLKSVPPELQQPVATPTPQESGKPVNESTPTPTPKEYVESFATKIEGFFEEGFDVAEGIKVGFLKKGGEKVEEANEASIDNIAGGKDSGKVEEYINLMEKYKDQIAKLIDAIKGVEPGQTLQQIILENKGTITDILKKTMEEVVKRFDVITVQVYGGTPINIKLSEDDLENLITKIADMVFTQEIQKEMPKESLESRGQSLQESLESWGQSLQESLKPWRQRLQESLEPWRQSLQESLEPWRQKVFETTAQKVAEALPSIVGKVLNKESWLPGPIAFRVASNFLSNGKGLEMLIENLKLTVGKEVDLDKSIGENIKDFIENEFEQIKEYSKEAEKGISEAFKGIGGGIDGEIEDLRGKLGKIEEDLGKLKAEELEKSQEKEKKQSGILTRLGNRFSKGSTTIEKGEGLPTRQESGMKIISNAKKSQRTPESSPAQPPQAKPTK